MKVLFCVICLIFLGVSNANTQESTASGVFSVNYAPIDTRWAAVQIAPDHLTTHTQWLVDFESYVIYAKSIGFNAVLFDMNYRKFHWTSTQALDDYPYAANEGFTAAECTQMAEIMRENDMAVIISFQVLTHNVGNVFSVVYPEYMLVMDDWAEGNDYTYFYHAVMHDGSMYRAADHHTSSSANEPPNATYWTLQSDSISDVRDPFNAAGEAIVHDMIDELIAAFTFEGEKPDAFHIGMDEATHWYYDAVGRTGYTSGEIFAMVINDVYDHIRASSPDMEIIMWGDMLDADTYGDGKPARQGTAPARYLIPTDIIIADWLYESTVGFYYDEATERFPTPGGFIDDGFRVWTASFDDIESTEDLVRTCNYEQTRTGKCKGHLYTTWYGKTMPLLQNLLEDPEYSGPSASLRRVADAILLTIDDVL